MMSKRRVFDSLDPVGRERETALQVGLGAGELGRATERNQKQSKQSPRGKHPSISLL